MKTDRTKLLERLDAWAQALDRPTVAALCAAAAAEIRAMEAIFGKLRSDCTIVYYPTDGAPPIEHSKITGIDGWDALLVALAREEGT